MYYMLSHQLCRYNPKSTSISAVLVRIAVRIHLPTSNQYNRAGCMYNTASFAQKTIQPTTTATNKSKMATIQIVTPNDDPSSRKTTTTIFLAGPTNDNWRDKFISLFQKSHHAQQQTTTTSSSSSSNPPSTQPTIAIIDPTQPKWDATWVTTDYYHPDDTRFRVQVDWELQRQTAANLVVFYFVEGQQAPISLMELGLALGRQSQSQGNSSSISKTVLVGCEKEYKHRGNVQAVCARFGVPLKENLDALVDAVVTAATAEARNV